MQFVISENRFIEFSQITHKQSLRKLFAFIIVDSEYRVISSYFHYAPSLFNELTKLKRCWKRCTTDLWLVTSVWNKFQLAIPTQEDLLLHCSPFNHFDKTSNNSQFIRNYMIANSCFVLSPADKLRKFSLHFKLFEIDTTPFHADTKVSYSAIAFCDG